VPESSRRTDGSLSPAIELARTALAGPPAGLLTDFDGTLSPIVADPAAAGLAVGADAALAELTARLAVVAVITGRAPLDARRMVGVPGILVVGNHGAEWLEPEADAPAATPEADRIRAALDDVLARVRTIPGTAVEAKGLSATVHYRTATDPPGARAATLAALGDLPPGLELREGRMSVELRPVGLGDKGSAARAVVERFGLRGVVVLGDDVTDLDMFDAVAQLRSDGVVRAAIIAVGGADREVPEAVMAAADASLSSPAEVALLLDALLRR
jgi:trehalose 6-phosphate phosphatase